MESAILKNLYTEKELQSKIEKYTVKYAQFRKKKDYPSVAVISYSIGRIFELLEDEENSEYYYQEVVDEWNDHSEKIPYHICVSALKALRRPEEAFEIVLEHARNWDLEDLAKFYRELGRPREANLLLTGMATYFLTLSNAYPSWRPHYLQKAADLYERAQDFELAKIHSEKAFEKWEEIKQKFGSSLHTIEKAWLHEEIGYICERNGEFEISMDYYEKAKTEYEQAYTEDSDAVLTHQVDGDWDHYLGFFAKQIPEFKFIFFRIDGPEENDYRRIKYRILNLKEQLKSR